MDAQTSQEHDQQALEGPLLLAKAQELAAAAHQGQVDHAQAPYTGHINRVVARAEALRAQEHAHLNHWDVAAAAYLHDALEDSELTADLLKAEGINQAVINAVTALTHTPYQRRDDYLEQVAANPIARVVKLADTEDNANPQRLALVAQRDPERAVRLRAKYAHARTQLDAGQGY